MTGTAEIYDAVLTPGKMDLLREWVPRQGWFEADLAGGDADLAGGGGHASLEHVTSYRFVDPEGAVGMESFLLSAVVGGARRTVHVPLTYRGEELAGAEGALVGTVDHSVLGQRWVYDAAADPVYLAEVRRVIVSRSGAADHLSMEDGTITPSPVHIRGGGDGGRTADMLPQPQIIRLLSEEYDSDADGPLVGSPGTLTGTWEDADGSHTAVFVVA